MVLPKRALIVLGLALGLPSSNKVSAATENVIYEINRQHPLGETSVLLSATQHCAAVFTYSKEKMRHKTRGYYDEFGIHHWVIEDKEYSVPRLCLFIYLPSGWTYGGYFNLRNHWPDAWEIGQNEFKNPRLIATDKSSSELFEFWTETDSPSMPHVWWSASADNGTMIQLSATGDLVCRNWDPIKAVGSVYVPQVPACLRAVVGR